MLKPGRWPRGRGNLHMLAEKRLDPVSPGLALRGMLGATLVERLGKLLQDGLLLVGQAHRRLDRDMAVQITWIARANAPHALAAQSERLAALRAFGNGDFRLAAQRGHLYVSAQGGGREGDRQFTMQIVAVALEDVVRLQPDLHIGIAGRPAIDTRLAVATGTDPHAVIDAGGNLHLQRLVLANTADALARGAGIGNDLAAAVAGRTCLLHAEET